MPHTKSAKKRLVQNEKRRARNRNAMKTLKLQLKKVQEASKAGDAGKLDAEIRQAAKKFDQAAAKGIVHRNLAARRKSQFAKLAKSAASK